MKNKPSNIPHEIVFYLLIGALFGSALILLGGGGIVSGDIILFSFTAFLVSFTPVFISTKAALKPAQTGTAYQPLNPRKDLIQRSDPLLM